MALRYKAKPASGAWSDERTFFDTGIHNSYPTLIETAPGEFRVVATARAGVQSATSSFGVNAAGGGAVAWPVSVKVVVVLFS
jgi:hypothetical protein